MHGPSSPSSYLRDWLHRLKPRTRTRIRAHDFVHAVDPSESRERLKIRLTCPLAVGPESFDGDVQPDLVPVLEAVGNGLFGRVHSHGNLVNHDDLDSGAEGRLRIPEDAQWNTIDSWHLSMTGQRKVDGVRDLCGQPMMGQGRDQAEDAPRNSNRDRNKIRASERRRSGDPVEPASRMFDLAAVSKRVQCPWVNPEADRLTCAEHSAVLGEHSARPGEASVGDRLWIESTDIIRCFRGFYPPISPAGPAGAQEADDREIWGDSGGTLITE